MPVPRPSWLPRVAVSVGGALLVLGPVLADPTRWLPGHPHSDGLKHLWSYWHTPATVATWPWTDALNAPAGGLLLDPMALPALLLAPVSAAVGPTAAANLWVFAMLVAAALGVARLADALGADSAGATVAAGLTVCAQPLLAYPVVCGVHERLSVALLPWLVAAMIRRARTGRGGFGPVVWLAPLALHCGVWAWLAALLLGAGLLLPRAVPLHRVVRPWLVGVGLLGGAYLVSRGWSADPMSLAPQPGRHGLLGPGGAVVRSASLSGLLWPAPPAFVEEGDLLMRGTHLGIVPLVLGAVAVGVGGRPGAPSAPLSSDAGCRSGLAGRARVWLLVVCAVLVAWALGPWPFGRLNPVYALSVWGVPLLGAWPEPGQLTLPLTLFLAALAGAGWTALPAPALRWGLVAAALVERGLAVPPVWTLTDTAPDPVWTALESPGPVATLPRSLPGQRLTPGAPFLAQIDHQQPIVASVFPGVSAWDAWSPLVHGASDDWGAARTCLLRGGIRYLALRADVLPDADRVRVALVEQGSTVVATSEAWTLLELGAPAADAEGAPPFRPLGAAPPPAGWLPPAPLPVGVHTVDRTRAECPVSGAL